MASNFDLNLTAQQLADAHEEPTITVGSNLYRGRLLSIEQWLPYYERLMDLEVRAREDNSTVTLRDFVKLWVDYLYEVFPRSRFKLWVPDPVAAIREIPGEGLKESFASFFSHQARVLGMSALVPMASETTPTSDSKNRTDVIVPSPVESAA